jgi:hypothetical protein
MFFHLYVIIKIKTVKCLLLKSDLLLVRFQFYYGICGGLSEAEVVSSNSH